MGIATTAGRRALDRPRVLAAALELVDEDGLAGLTMRRLGDRLGVEAMSLYRHVPGKEDLLDGVVELCVDELYRDPVVRDHSRGWREYLEALAHGVRHMALRHPQVFPLIATRAPAAPWVRPPLRSLRWVEDVLDTLLTAGFGPAQAVAAYRSLSSFLAGHLLLEVSGRGVDTGPVGRPEGPARAVADLTEYPRLRELAPELAHADPADEFAVALGSLLDRLGEGRTG